MSLFRYFTSEPRLTLPQIGDQYPKFATSRYYLDVRRLIGDIIRAERRNARRTERRLDPNLPKNKVGRPVCPDSQRERLKDLRGQTVDKE